MKNKKTLKRTSQKHADGFLTNICAAVLYGICLLGLCAHSAPTQEWSNSIDKNAIPAECPSIPQPKRIPASKPKSKPKRFKRRGGGWYTKMPWE